MDQLEQIEEITKQVNRLLYKKPRRQPEDVDLLQLCKAWGKSEATVRRIMLAIDRNREKSGFMLIEVFDPDQHHLVKVLRKISPDRQ